jgi:hypothetical protein
MIRRGIGFSLALLASSAAAAQSQGVAIDHKAVGCIVVGKYPKMNACFTPAADLARSRVYFRPEGVPSWYYVDMKTDQPCFTGTLPKPGKKLVGKKIEYYVEAQNKTFEPARTAEFAPIVVKSAQECKKNVPVAPFVNNATVAVFPSVPAGFVGGGIGTAAVVGIVGAGAAAATTAAVVATNNNDTTTTTAPPVVVVPTTTTTLATVTTTTTTLPAKTNKPPFAVLTTNPDPPSGTGPLTVTFDLCKSTDPDGDPLSYFFNFGDGSKTSGSCIESHTYSSNFRAAADVSRQDRSYNAEACVVDTSENGACRSRTVNATNPVAPPPKTVTLQLTKTGDTGNGAVSDDKGQINCPFGCVSASATYAQGTTVTLTASSAFFYVIWTWNGSAVGGCSPSAPTCTITLTGDQAVTVDFNNTGFKEGPTAENVPWRSEVRMQKAELQVTANGTSSLVLREGDTSGVLSLAAGENRIEARVVSADGKAGTWRFHLAPGGVVAGTLRVLAGDVALVTDSEVVFQLTGKAGEQFVFTFKKQ